ncbi:P-loop containing nucleoside triphosphate hydrolase protein [Gaertneriomyces semiglobifer]|nr:P-loop containing nucleoside triphosphate hydrolase protein [Gaertneriomyces semiglobifer]
MSDGKPKITLTFKKPSGATDLDGVASKKRKDRSDDAAPSAKRAANGKRAVDTAIMDAGDVDGENDDGTEAARIREHFTGTARFAKLAVKDEPTSHDGKAIRDAVSKLFTMENAKDYTFLAQKGDHRARPLWVCDDGRIILEAFSPLAGQAEDFLITIAEPVSRPARVHEFKLTAYSLYAAVSVGMETKTILDVLERFSKVKVPERVVNFIEDCTKAYGKVKLVLKDNRYFLESSYPEVLKKLLTHPEIAKARLTRADDAVLPTPASSTDGTKGGEDFGAVITLDSMDDDDDGDDESEFVHSFEIDKSMVEDVKKHCIGMDYPLMEEYDFRHDNLTPNLDIDLNPKTLIRDYQEKSLSKMFGGGGGRARSGIIVLPTGAGKTLVGITAACTVKKNTLVLCTNALSVEQWAREFRNWSTVKEGSIAKFTADDKKRFQGDAGIVVSTYTMISHSGNRSWETARMIEWINSVEWGLLILDEVHVVPANVFRRVLTTVSAHTKLGLTATLVREDDKIEDLNFLIGPKLYEANWLDLAHRGHIAKVEATEVWCGMTADFYQEYMGSRPSKRRLLCVMNPTKFRACQYLIKKHESLGDKIIVFSDDVYGLQYYAKKLNKPFIYGNTAHAERQAVLSAFRGENSRVTYPTIFLSKVGDTSLDLPEATCLIQISSQFGSRRQEAQRMGRILRAKRRNEEGFRSKFYTLVSRDTDEVQFSAKRKRFLIDQGYEYKVIPSVEQLVPESERNELFFRTREDQLELLQEVQKANEDELDPASGDIRSRKRLKLDEAARKAERQRREEEKAREKKQNSLFRKWNAGKF